jgi:recyclin-1
LRFKQAYTILRPLLRYIHPSTPPHSLLSILLPTPPLPPQATSPTLKIAPPTLQIQAQLLSLFTRFLSSSFKPLPDWDIRAHALRSTIDVFEANLLKSFEDADEIKDEKGTREAAYAAWEIFTAWGVPPRKDIIGKALDIGTGLHGGLGRLVGIGGRKTSEWEVGKVWIERREEFHEQGKWDPLANFTYVFIYFLI